VYEKPIQAKGLVTEVRRAGVFEVELPNGKKVCGHLAKGLRTPPAPGQRVTLELTPYDFDTARISAIESSS
jgi:translation initiation factor IF-1